MRSPTDAGDFAGRKFEVSTAAAAVMVGVPVYTIRNWATRGYLQPVRREGTKAVYDADAVARTAARFGYLPDLRQEQDARCCAPNCDRLSWPDVPIPLCQKCAVAIWLHVGDEWNRRLHDGTGEWPDGDWDPGRDHAGSQQPVVYFVQVGDLVKIGTTTSLPKRLADLQANAQERARVLLALPGSYLEEKSIHKQFKADRVRGEWFTPSPAMQEFVRAHFDDDIRHVHGPLVAR
jgi:hypothetical protein